MKVELSLCSSFSRQKKRTRSGFVVRDTCSVKGSNRKLYGFDGCQAVPIRPPGKDRLVARLNLGLEECKVIRSADRRLTPMYIGCKKVSTVPLREQFPLRYQPVNAAQRNNG